MADMSLFVVLQANGSTVMARPSEMNWTLLLPRSAICDGDHQNSPVLITAIPRCGGGVDCSELDVRQRVSDQGNPAGSERVANLVLVSCEAFDHYLPGLPCRLLCLNAALPGGTFLTAQLLRPRWIRHLPVTFGALSKRRVPDDLFRSWIGPLRHNPKVRRDLTKYLRTVPKPQHLLEWADQQRTFAGPVLIIWAREDTLMPPAHAERLAAHFQNTQLVWIDDSRTLIPIDQPQMLTDHLHTFLATHT